MTFLIIAGVDATVFLAWSIAFGFTPSQHDESSRPAASAGPLAEFSKDEINLAALRMIHGRVPYVFPSYLDGTMSDVISAERALAALRNEYAEYEPERMRREILKWLDYYDAKLAETRKDIETQKSKNSNLRYRAAIDDKNRRVDDILSVVAQDKKAAALPKESGG